MRKLRQAIIVILSLFSIAISAQQEIVCVVGTYADGGILRTDPTDVQILKKGVAFVDGTDSTFIQWHWDELAYDNIGLTLIGQENSYGEITIANSIYASSAIARDSIIACEKKIIESISFPNSDDQTLAYTNTDPDDNINTLQIETGPVINIDDNHLGPNDQTLTGNRTVNMANFDLYYDNVTHRITVQKGRRILFTSNNINIGDATGNSITSGSNITNIGYQSGFLGTAPSFSVHIGYRAGFTTNGTSNVFVGNQAGRRNTTGNSNSLIGAVVGSFNTTGSFLVGVGSQTIYNNTTGSFNSGIGYQALYFNEEGSQNTAMGYRALYRAKGSFNTGFGYLSGPDEAQENIIWSNALGSLAQPTESYQTVVGGSNGQKVSINGALGALQNGGQLNFYDYGGATSFLENVSQVNGLLAVEANGDISKVAPNLLPVCPVGQIAKSTGAGYACAPDLTTDPGGGDVDYIQTLSYANGTLTAVGVGSAFSSNVDIYQTLDVLGLDGTNIDISLSGDQEATKQLDLAPLLDFNLLSNTPTIPTLTSDLTNDSGYITSPDDADPDPTNEIQTITSTSGDVTVTPSGIDFDLDINFPTDQNTQLTEAQVDAFIANNVPPYITDPDDADSDPANEIQDLELTNDILKVTNNASATNIDLSAYSDNTDDQTIGMVNDVLFIEGHGTGVDFSGFKDDDISSAQASANSVEFTEDDGTKEIKHKINVISTPMRDYFGAVFSYDDIEERSYGIYMIAAVNVGLTPISMTCGADSGAGTVDVNVQVNGVSIFTQAGVTMTGATFPITGASALTINSKATFVLSNLSGTISGMSCTVNTEQI